MAGVVEVVAAVIERPDGSFLLASRPRGKVYAGYWEFPGGKVEAGEQLGDALTRELLEELGVEVREAYPWITRTHDYPHGHVRLHFHRVTKWRGEPTPHEGQSLSWQRFPDLTVSPMLPANAPVLKSLRIPTTMGITHAWETGTSAAIDQLRLARQRGLRMVQVREMQLEVGQREAFARSVMSEMRDIDAIVCVNNDLALAKAIGAGLHLRSDALMDSEARPLVHWCGASCHNAEQLNKAYELGLDYAVLGPVAATPSHPGLPALGWGKFAELARGFPIPVFALGGLRKDDLARARSNGAHGIAMIRGAWSAA